MIPNELPSQKDAETLRRELLGRKNSNHPMWDNAIFNTVDACGMILVKPDTHDALLYWGYHEGYDTNQNIFISGLYLDKILYTLLNHDMKKAKKADSGQS